jgi:8-oxo-dGTP diphosphatase
MSASINKAVGAALVNKRGEFLLQLRDDNPSIPHPGVWSIVSGAIEPGESESNAVKREIKEELGCDADGVEFLEKMYVDEVETELWVFKGFLDVKANDINLSEGRAVKYFRIDEIKKLDMPEFLRKYIVENEERIKSRDEQ